MKRYFLELGQLAPSKQEYSYSRRALGVTHTMQWKQDCISDSIEALKERFKHLERFHFKGRIWELGGYIVWKSTDERS